MTYKKINLMLPTRGRVERLKKFIESAIATALEPRNLCFTIMIDESDSATMSFLESFSSGCGCAVSPILWTEPQPHLGRMYNQLYGETPFKDAVVSMVGDDMVFETPGWDRKILDVINDCDGWAVVGCDDGYIQHGKIFVNLFTTRRVVEATGGPFMSEEFPMDFIDVVWTHLAELTKTRVYLDDVVIQHEHSACSGDETRERLRALRGTFEAGIRRAMEIAAGYAPKLIEAMTHA